jgi:hypothetical protein
LGLAEDDLDGAVQPEEGLQVGVLERAAAEVGHLLAEQDPGVDFIKTFWPKFTDNSI